MKITVEFFDDVGFQEGAVEVPSYGNLELEQEGMEYTDVHPAKGRIFDSIRVKEYFAKARCWNYLKLTMVNNSDESDTGVEQIYYGWVDNVAMASDNEEAPMVDVSWRVDLWRTWLKDAKFGYGMVVNRPDVGERPIQDLPYRFYETEVSDAITSINTLTISGLTYKVVWLIVCYIQPNEGDTVTTPSFTMVPLLMQYVESRHEWHPTYIDVKFYLDDAENYPVTSQRRVLSGQFLIDWGLTPSQVTGCWLTTQPFIYSSISLISAGSTVQVPQVKFSLSVLTGGFELYGRNKDNYYYYAFPCIVTPPIITQDLGMTHRSTEEVEFGLCNFEGELMWKAPTFLPFRYIKKQLQISPTTCSLDVYYAENKDEEFQVIKNKGMHISIALPEHSLAENSWSDYVVSGQKDAVRQQRRIQQQQQLVSGLTGTLSGGVQGATMGTLAGGGVGLLAGASVATGLISTGVNYFASGHFNDKLNKLSDTLAAKQIDSIAVSGGSLAWASQTYQIDGRMHMIRIIKDEYSRAQFRNQIALNGLDVSEPTSDCTEACHGTGPYRIQNLIVTGSIPSEARAYIKQRFNDGVRLS